MTVPTRKPTSARKPALVRDLASRGTAPHDAAPELRLEARPAIDFLISLIGDTEPELLPGDAAWRQASRDSLTAPLRRDVARAFADDESETARSITGWAFLNLIVPREEVRTAADAVAFAAQITAADLVRVSCAEKGPLTLDPAALGALAARYFAGDDDLRDEILAATPDSIRAPLGRLLEDPDGELRALRRVLRAWQERFAVIEPRVTRMQERDIAGRRAALARLSTTEFIETATNGLRWSPPAPVRTIHLIPSYFARPYNYTFGGDGWHLFAYPLAEEALDGDPGAVPAATLRLFRSLGDESRLRILRHLADGDLYLTEIADRMGISKPTAKHHLAQLRAAGLVTVTETGGLTYYSLRRDRIAETGAELTRYLDGPARA